MKRAFAIGFLALASCSVSAAHCVAAASNSFPVKAFLCDSAEHAIQFAELIAKGRSEEIARDRVGRTARAEVCGHYAGIAVIESRRIKVADGAVYKLTAYRFEEDHQLAWLAERSFAPTSSDWDL